MLNIATIVSANYLAYAVTLGKSLQREHPEAKFSVLIVDRPTEAIKEAAAASKLDITYGAELGLPDFEHIAFKYDIVELSSSAYSPWARTKLSTWIQILRYLRNLIQCSRSCPLMISFSLHMLPNR
jgi:hypothetical protein